MLRKYRRGNKKWTIQRNWKHSEDKANMKSFKVFSRYPGFPPPIKLTAMIY
jgi:hypothetical protein